MDREAVDRRVQEVSRTFALSIQQLPGALRQAIAVAYLMFRISDGIEDHADLPAAEKIELLDLWRHILETGGQAQELAKGVADVDDPDPEVRIIREANLVLGWFHELPEPYQRPIRRHVIDTTEGMARWQAHGPFVEDEEALDDYMHEVAGRVGYLVTDLFAVYSPAIAEVRESLMPLSRHCGLALQTVNVIRGISKDRQRGWVFVPQTYCAAVGIAPERFFEPANQAAAMQVVAMLADKADRHLAHGLDYITRFPRTEHSIRLAIMWPFFFAVRTLAVSRNNPTVLTGEAKMTRTEIMHIVAQTKLLGWSNTWLRHYYRQLAAARPAANMHAVASAGRQEQQRDLAEPV